MSTLPEIPAAGSEIEPIDPAQPFRPTLLIAEILRTTRCVPGSIFLVEAVDSKRITGRYRTVRLLLGDGELCIQTLLVGEMHELVETGVVYEGCYVRLDRFDMRFYELKADAGTTGPRMAYLFVRGLVSVGWNKTYVSMARCRAVPIDIEDGGELKKANSAEPTNKTTVLPWVSSDLTKPLRLTPLGSIPNLPYKQNWTVNVLAVVASLSGLEPSKLAPHSQRTARLADPSTAKQVLLTVFLDPADFAPAVGSVVLLVGLKNHGFDGGSLKKYASERARAGGARWWFEEPAHLAWCDVAGMRTWWDDKQLGGAENTGGEYLVEEDSRWALDCRCWGRE